MKVKLYLWFINKLDMAIKTKTNQDKIKRDNKIRNQYFLIMQDPESQKYGAYEVLSKRHGLSCATIGRIVGNIKRNIK